MMTHPLNLLTQPLADELLAGLVPCLSPNIDSTQIASLEAFPCPVQQQLSLPALPRRDHSCPPALPCYCFDLQP